MLGNFSFDDITPIESKRFRLASVGESSLYQKITRVLDFLVDWHWKTSVEGSLCSIGILYFD